MRGEIKGIVFDMDGLMVDSEPLWHIAETKCFEKVGITLTEANCLETTGLRINEAVEHQFQRFGGWDESIRTRAELSQDIVEEMERMLKIEGSKRMKPGLLEALDFFKSLELPMTGKFLTEVLAQLFP